MKFLLNAVPEHPVKNGQKRWVEVAAEEEDVEVAGAVHDQEEVGAVVAAAVVKEQKAVKAKVAKIPLCSVPSPPAQEDSSQSAAMNLHLIPYEMT